MAIRHTAISASRLGERLGMDLAPLEGPRGLLGAAIVRALPLSRFRPIDSPRMAFRVELDDGRLVKLRRFRDTSRPEEVDALLAAAAPGDLARVLHRVGTLLIEEWVDGRTLTPADRDQLIAAGALLGRLHTLDAGGARSPRACTPTGCELATFLSDLDELRRRGALDAPRVMRLAGAAERHDPGTTDIGVIHGDFCGENIVLGASGRLCAIDNEHVAIGSLDGDLNRSGLRWALDRSAHDLFLAGYRPFRDPSGAERHRVFWQLRWLAHSARIRLLEGDDRACADRVEALLHLASDEAGAETLTAVAR